MVAYKVIEPPHLLEYVEEQYRHLAPRVVKDEEGYERFAFEGKSMSLAHRSLRGRHAQDSGRKCGQALQPAVLILCGSDRKRGESDVARMQPFDPYIGKREGSLMPDQSALVSERSVSLHT
jgi:hypothetical protein